MAFLVSQDRRQAAITLAPEILDQDLPYAPAHLLIELGHADCDVDPGLKGLVKGTDTMVCEEHDAIDVLERAQED